MFCGVVRDAVGFKNVSFEQSGPRVPLKESTFFTGWYVCGSDCSIEIIGIQEALLRLPKNARLGPRSENCLSRSTDPTASELALKNVPQK